MKVYNNFRENPRRNEYVNGLIGVYFFIAIIETIAEFLESQFFVFISKPFLVPILFIMYVVKSRKYNLIYILAIVFAWLSDVFFISHRFIFLSLGSVSFLLFLILFFYFIIKHVKFKGYLSLIIGCIPFLLGYYFFYSLAQNQLKEMFYSYIVTGVLIVILGGYSLGSYILNPSKSNTFLALSIFLLASAQFVFVLEYYFAEIKLLHSFQILLYTIAQYLIFEFVVLEERRKRYHEIRNKSLKIDTNL